MIRRAITFWQRCNAMAAARPGPDTSPRCGLCGKAWPAPSEPAFIPGPHGPRRALVCSDHLEDQ